MHAMLAQLQKAQAAQTAQAAAVEEGEQQQQQQIQIDEWILTFVDLLKEHCGIDPDRPIECNEVRGRRGNHLQLLPPQPQPELHAHGFWRLVVTRRLACWFCCPCCPPTDWL